MLKCILNRPHYRLMAKNNEYSVGTNTNVIIEPIARPKAIALAIP